jgi:hypothetical protein
MKRNIALFGTAIILLIASPACKALPTSSTNQSVDSTAGMVVIPGASSDVEFLSTRISMERMYSFLDGLTSIQPYSGWRTSATEGEYQALKYVENDVENLPFLAGIGLETEWQTFHTYLSTQTRQSTLQISYDEKSFDIPANSLRGSLDTIAGSLLMDSDGKLNDSYANPQQVIGSILAITDEEDLQDLDTNQAQGKILFVNYALLDGNTYKGDTNRNLSMLLDCQPSALVLVTQNSMQKGTSHGTFVNEAGPLSDTRFPVLHVRLEDMSLVGITSWDQLALIESATLTWDQDVYSPGTSHNFIVHIPGKDPSRAVILSAHIDSVDNPGAMDDASGCAILLEIAHVLNDSQVQPPNDIYLVWFGSEELGLYGSAYFVNTHQELLDRTVADLQIDCLTRPLEGIRANLQLAFWPGNWSDTEASAWVNYLHDQMKDQSVETHKMVMDLSSDNSMFDGYNVPNLDVILDADDEMNSVGGVWVGGHIHDPYDDVTTARDSSLEFRQMAQIALTTALLPSNVGEFRDTPSPTRRALFIGTHTEPSLMSPAGLTDFSTMLAEAGFNVDLIPYGQSFTFADLANVKTVFVLPVADYPGGQEGENGYDESWQPSEVDALQAYVDEGGLLVITNSSQLTSFYGSPFTENEDWQKMNALSSAFGIIYSQPEESTYFADVVSPDSLTENMRSVNISNGTAVAFALTNGRELAATDDGAVIGVVPYGSHGGEVVALADLNILGAGWYGLNNDDFCTNFLNYLLTR